MYIVQKSVDQVLDIKIANCDGQFNEEGEKVQWFVTSQICSRPPPQKEETTKEMDKSCLNLMKLLL